MRAANYIIIPAIPDVPMMMIGTQIWASMSTSLATLHGASTNCDENNPPGDMPKTCMDSMMNISANRKFGVASPMNPRNVNNWSESDHERYTCLSAYFRTTRFSRSPLARATLICALPTISKTLPRITLIIPAIPDVPMMMIGTQIWASMSTSLATLHGAST